MTNVFEAYIKHLSKDGKKVSDYVKLINYWCYRQLLGLFPLIGDPLDSPYNLLDHWTSNKKKLILLGKCVSVELGEDIVIASVNKVERNLSDRILNIEIELDDNENTKMTLFTETGKATLSIKIGELKKEESSKNWISKVFTSKQEEIKYLENKLREGDKKFVYWQNNCDNEPDMRYTSTLLEDLNTIHEDMIWDRKRSRKQIVVSAAKKPGDAAWAATKNHLEEDYVCLIYPDDELPGDIKYKLENPTSQQKDLWEDHYKTLDFLKRMLGILHNSDKKKERHNIPEMGIMESQFLIFQQEKKEFLEKGIREWIRIFGGDYNLKPMEIKEQESEENCCKENCSQCLTQTN